MASKYLGFIGRMEAHAFSENGCYRDERLCRVLYKMRYDVLAETRKPIFCTAVNPDHELKRETNPHDALSSTMHFGVIDVKTGRLEYALSVARYSREFGVPLENRFSPNGYPLGASLDMFIGRYVRKGFGVDKDVDIGRIIELYRHVRSSRPGLSGFNSQGARLILYWAVYQELVRNALEKGKMAADLWVWDAVPEYADKYAYVGGVFRDIATRTGRWIPTWKKGKMTETIQNGVCHCYYAGEKVTRSVLVPHPPKDGQYGRENSGERREVGMIDGLVDIGRCEYAIAHHPHRLFSLKRWPGFREFGQRLAMGIVARRAYRDHHGRNMMNRMAEFVSDALLGTKPWVWEKEAESASHSLLSSGFRYED